MAIRAHTHTHALSSRTHTHTHTILHEFTHTHTHKRTHTHTRHAPTHTRTQIIQYFWKASEPSKIIYGSQYILGMSQADPSSQTHFPVYFWDKWNAWPFHTMILGILNNHVTFYVIFNSEQLPPNIWRKEGA